MTPVDGMAIAGRPLMPAKRTSLKPWKRPNPAKKRTRLTAKSRTAAKSAAKRAGRKYPNLVDNMRAAAMQKRRKKS